jgi:hypothetical protein
MVSLIVAIIIAFPLDRDDWFDIVLTLGGGLLTVGIIFALQGPLTEKNKPEN